MSSSLKKFKNFILGDFKSFAEMKQVKIPKTTIVWSVLLLLLSIAAITLNVLAMLKYDSWHWWDSFIIISFYTGASALFFSAFLYMTNFPSSRLLLIITTVVYNYLLAVLISPNFFPLILIFLYGISFVFVYSLNRFKKVPLELGMFIWNIVTAVFALFPFMAFFGRVLLGSMFSDGLLSVNFLKGALMIAVFYFLIMAFILPARHRIRKVK